MKSYLEQKNMKLDEKNRQKHEKERIDNTGQKLFKPRILSKR